MWKIHPFVASDIPAAHPRSFPKPLPRTAPIPTVAEPPPPPVRVAAPVPAPFTFRLALGLVGVLIAVLVSGFNDQSSMSSLPTSAAPWVSGTTKGHG